MIDFSFAIGLVATLAMGLLSLWLYAIDKHPKIRALLTVLIGVGIVLLFALAGISPNGSTHNNSLNASLINKGSEIAGRIINMTIPSRPSTSEEALVLYNVEPVEGIRNLEAGPTQDNLGNTFYNSLAFSVSSFDESLESESLIYTNTNNYTVFSGVFYVPKLPEGSKDNVVQFMIRLDDRVSLDTGIFDQYSDPYRFNLNIANAKKIEITCYFVEGSSSGIIGGGSRAYGNLSEALFFYD